jgi:transcriptional regulator with XRE-family HTH domain
VWNLIHSEQLTLSQLTKATGLSHSIIARTLKEDSYCSPSVKMIYRFAQYFKVTTDYLLGLEPTKVVLDGEIAKFLDKKENRHIRESLVEITHKSKRGHQ